MSRWTDTRLGFVTSLIQTGPFGSQLHARDYQDDGVAVVNPSDMIDNQINFATAKRISPARAELLHRHKLRRGDLVVARRGELGRCALVSADSADSICGTGSLLVRTRPGQTSARFLCYIVSSQHFVEQLQLESVGSSMDNLNARILSGLSIRIPRIDDQESVVDFLARKTAAIDDLIGEKTRLRELLAEKRTALINQAVTRGLDPGVAMKDSGVDWIGSIPEHWSLVQLRRVLLEICDGPFGSGLKSSHYRDEGVRVLRLQNIRSGRFDDSNRAYISESHFNSLGGHDARSGDLIIAGLGDQNHPVGRACVLPPSIDRALVKADCYRARLDQFRLSHTFAAEYLSSASAGAGFGATARGSTRARINLEVVKDAWVVLPPHEEQVAIVRRCKEIRAHVSGVLRDLKDQIVRLREYRQALITAAVTGQIDIPAA